MSIFARIKAAAAALTANNTDVTPVDNSDNVTVNYNDQRTVKVKFSVSDVQNVEIADEVTVADVITSAARLSGTSLNQEYNVLCNGEVVDLDDTYVSGNTYKVVFNSGTAG